ncbi:MAG: Outer membrane protein assembly factor BamA [candidate division TM6 bacterium GW2011_GWF2_28_16]|nr:MAG: Outer membrane protein assembly factor BamA [candidate division TM6 bacterium GW2011_GWF2_28_16]
MHKKFYLNKFLFLIVVSFCFLSLNILQASESLKINKIIINGNNHVKKYTIMNRLPWKPGEDFDESKSAIAINNVYNLGYFRQVKIKKEILKHHKVNIYVKVEEKKLLAKLEFEGNKVIDSKKIREELALDKLTTVDEETGHRICNGIKKLYADESYHKTEVKYLIIPDPNVPEKVTAKFIVDQGPKSNVVRVNFIGNTKIPERKLRKMITTREEWLLGFVEDAGKFKQDDLEMDKHRIEFLYRDKGYLTTTVQKADVKYSKENKNIEVTFYIKEGDQFKISKIDVSNEDNDEKVTTEKQLEYISLEENKPYSQSKMAESITSLRDYWGTMGYINADVYPQVKPDEETKSVNITFFVEPGKKLYVNRVNITGNTFTRDKVIRRQIDLEEGDLITTKKLNRSKANVEYLSFFERGGVNWKIHRLNDEKANLELNVKETKTGNANVGISYGSDKFNPRPSLKGQVSVEKKNLFGMGFDAGAMMQGNRHGFQRLEATYYDPALFDSDSSVFATIYKRWEEYEQWANVNVMPKESTLGASGRFGFLLPKWDKRLQFVTELGIENIKNNQPHAVGANSEVFEPLVRQKFQQGTLSWLCLDLIKDTRNHKIYPNHGYRIMWHNKIAPPAINLEYSFIKSELEGSWYTPLIGDDNLVFMIHGKTGVVTPVGGTYITQDTRKKKIIPYKELFHMGGQDTVRGFIWGGIEPAWITNAPLGAKYMIQLNVELQFPLIPDYSMRGHLFYDAGAGWNTPKDEITNKAFIKRDKFDLRHAVGFGLNLTQPMPAKIDWGYKLDRDKAAGESAHEFHLNMNYAW